ncbi:PilZ domain-containing protein [Paenibacillus sp. P26]|nr:PilZ domain-containing protein [Paenibacillus sp. P26]UUZ95909.1 PilZ domain-containing protein [Paenibacillus sp. P25]
MVTDNNKRSFFRVSFRHPLGGEVKLIGWKDRNPDFLETKAAILDLSAGGARILTAAPLPEEPGLLVELRFTALGVLYRPIGLVVRTLLPVEGQYEYSIQFSLNEPDTAALTGMLNQLAIKLRKTPTPSNCSFCTEEELTAFHSLALGNS